MKKFKRLIALVTVAMFILSFAAPAAFAADTTTTTTTTSAATKIIGKDVKGTKYEKAAAKLIALGIVNGFEDGSIKPETEVTRAQFAAIIAKELKLGDGVPSATKFKDVPASHWASGVINLAVGKGIIHGYPNGTFKPDAPVTYAEAAAMLVQTLGYGPALKGAPWPAGVLSMAGSSGISKGVSLNPSGKALRGDVIIMAANALTADIMKQTVWGTEQYWEKQDNTTLLEEVFNLNVYDKDTASKDKDYNDKMPTVDKVARFDLDGLDANEVEFTGNSELNGTFEVVGRNIDPNAFMGQEVEVWADPDAKEVYYIGNSNNETVVYDKVKEFVTENGKEKIKLDISGDKYEVLGDAKIYYNIDPSAQEYIYMDSTDKADLNGANVKVVLNDDDQVKAMIVDDFYGQVPSFEGKLFAGLVKEVKDTKIEFYNDSTTDDIDLDDTDYVIIKDGIVSELKDIKANDIVNIYSNDDEDQFYIQVTSTQVKGKVEKVVTSEIGVIAKYDITIAGKKYDCAEVVTFSEDNNKSISKADGDDLTDLDGQEVTAYLDAQGNIKHVSTGKLEDSGKLYAVVTKPAKYDSFNDEVKFTVVNKAGSTVDFKFDPSDVKLDDEELTGYEWTQSELGVATGLSATEPVVIEYKLDSAGKLTKVWIVSDDSDWETLTSVDPDDVADTFGDYDVESDTIIFDYTGGLNADGEVKDVKVVNWANVETKEDVDALVKTDDDKIDIMVVTGLTGSLGSDAKYGVVTGFTTKGGDDALEILNEKGEKEVVVYDGADISEYIYGDVADTKRYTAEGVVKVKKGDFIRYELDTDGEIDELQVLANTAEVTNLNDINGVNDDGDSILDVLNLDSVKVITVDNETSRSITGIGHMIDENGLIENGSIRASINESTVIFDISDTSALKKVSSVSDDDVILAVDTDDDGSVADFVVIIND